MELYDRSLYKREPITEIDGLPVFIDPEILTEVDEYIENNPYRDETTSESVWDRFRRNTIINVTHGPKVLDLGCGEGDMTRELASHFDYIAASDLSITAVELNRKRNPKVHFCVSDACDLPYIDGFFDSVVCANLFEHVESPPALLKSVRSTLKESGRFVFSTPSRYRTMNLRRVILGKPIQFNSIHHVTEYTNGQVEELLRRYGFKLIIVYSNLTCRTLIGTVAAYTMQGIANFMGSHLQVGDPTIYVAEKV